MNFKKQVAMVLAAASVAGLLGVGVEGLKGPGAYDDDRLDPVRRPPAWRLLVSFGILARF